MSKCDICGITLADPQERCVPCLDLEARLDGLVAIAYEINSLESVSKYLLTRSLLVDKLRKDKLKREIA